eukprot:3289044-Amphidinium_carterae.1
MSVQDSDSSSSYYSSSMSREGGDEDGDFGDEPMPPQSGEHDADVPVAVTVAVTTQAPMPPAVSSQPPVPPPPPPAHPVPPVSEETLPSIREATAEAGQLMQVEFETLLSTEESYQSRLEICISIVGKARHHLSVARARMQLDLGFDQAETSAFMTKLWHSTLRSRAFRSGYRHRFVEERSGDGRSLGRLYPRWH